MITECAKNRLEPLLKLAKNHLGPDNNPYVAQIVTPERAKFGPHNNYIYIYML